MVLTSQKSTIRGTGQEMGKEQATKQRKQNKILLCSSTICLVRILPMRFASNAIWQEASTQQWSWPSAVPVRIAQTWGNCPSHPSSSKPSFAHHGRKHMRGCPLLTIHLVTNTELIPLNDCMQLICKFPRQQFRQPFCLSNLPDG